MVVCTLARNSDQIEEAMAVGASGYFVKPLGEAAFQKAIRSLSDYWLQVRRRPEQGQEGDAPAPA